MCMADLTSEASALGVLIGEVRGWVGVVLGTAQGEVRQVIGPVRDSDAAVLAAAVLSRELDKTGTLLGLGKLEVASIKAATATRVVAHQSGAVLMMELDPKRPVGEVEAALRTRAWAPEQVVLDRSAV